MHRIAMCLVVLLLNRPARAEHDVPPRVRGLMVGLPAAVLGVTAIAGNGVAVGLEGRSVAWAVTGIAAGALNLGVACWSLVVRGCKTESDCTEPGSPFSGELRVMTWTWMGVGAASSALAVWNLTLPSGRLAILPSPSGAVLAGRW
jgi:hypothetical protein